MDSISAVREGKVSMWVQMPESADVMVSMDILLDCVRALSEPENSHEGNK